MSHTLWWIWFDFNKVKIDRIPSFTHWGRIDSRTGIDQRAEVGLLSRNVRFYGELGAFSIFVDFPAIWLAIISILWLVDSKFETFSDHSKGCQYAFTREQLSQSSVNHVCEKSPTQCAAAGITNGTTPLDWGCEYYKNVNGEDKDR